MKSGMLVAVTAALLVLTAAARADVEISRKPTSNMSCDSGVCTATAQKAVLNVSDLATMLASGDVAVKTGSLAKDIDIYQPLQWTSTSRLTLDAERSVTVKKPVTVSGTGAVTIETNDGSGNDDLLFANKGSLTFWDTSSSLIIGGRTYTLVKDIAALAADIANNFAGSYALANSYDAKHDRFDNVPIPTDFYGTFEGLGQSILHLKLKRSTKCKIVPADRCEGFFAALGSTAIVRDLKLSKVNISYSDARWVGGLAGLSLGTIKNISVDGGIHGSGGPNTYAGGLLGGNQGGNVVSTEAVVSVSGDGVSTVGGLIGGNFGDVANSHASGDVSGGDYIGGLAGVGYNFFQCYATGSVTSGDGTTIGGLVGSEVGTIAQSYATGAVVAGNDNARAGGLVGAGSGISNSYATGSVTGGSHKNEIGGLAGEGFTITLSYSIGAVGGRGGSAVGGFIGKSGGRGNQQDYWDTDTSGTSQGCGRGGDCSGLSGLTSEQLQSGLPAGFDPKIWGQSPSINNGYPYLLANPPR
ncbi:MAG TPA: GLUG motif-containing protein [Rhizomicrobium sp.]|jgi:hypothetical protein|nr:GLUG motif-containing protein [Rhizomicrobium sp.]